MLPKHSETFQRLLTATLLTLALLACRQLSAATSLQSQIFEESVQSVAVFPD